MPCYNPRKGFRSKTVNESGKRGIVFSVRDGFKDMPVTVPCGECIGCKKERARCWTIRIIQEGSLHRESCFLTLTYKTECLPEYSSLQLEDFQNFMKRLRKKLEPLKIRYFACGEYGKELSRPHYHAVIFGIDLRNTLNGKLLNYESSSKMVEEEWDKGFNTVGDFNEKTAAYVAGYVTKKILGESKDLHYGDVDKRTGEIKATRLPEFTVMSRRPGIGSGWYEKYREETYVSDSVIMGCREVKPPKYYDAKEEKVNPLNYAIIKAMRKEIAKKKALDNGTERLIAKEVVAIATEKLRKRSYENA